MQVRNRFIFSGIVNVIRLPNLNHTLNVNQTVIVSGWSRFNGYISDHLQRVQLVIGNHKSCRKIYNSELSAKFLFFTYHKKSEVCLSNNGPFRVRELQHFCAYDPNFMRGNCQFDSGGALTDNGVLVGLVSWGDPLHCGGFDYPVVCIKVSNYINWINENVG
ncbi:chymotrypsin-2-like [Leptopilina heterotoma]|uniref:chymotrypsin-2-like n=1 Tax=Leptopilina heterotoma TaxID=63436 RepID=UPI001CA8D4A1|nr:chymotrypsin-2-like [Leptopilina heterotoma]